MPARNTALTPINLKCSKKNSTKKTSKKKISMEVKLSNPRSQFCVSRKRVDIFKKTSHTERTKITGNPIEDSWITSGRIGSRDAVLVFRTSILNKNSKKIHMDKTSSSYMLKSSLSYSRCHGESIFAPSMGSSLPSSIGFGNNPIFSKKEKSSCDIEHFSPRNCLPSIKMYSRHPTKVEEKDSKEALPKALKTVQNDTKYHISKSLSCSDNSISSDFEDLADIDDLENINDAQIERHYNINATLTPKKENQEINDESHKDDEISIIDEPFSQNMPALELKLTYKFMQTETKLLRKIFLRHGLTEVESNENFSILWTGVHMKPDILRNLAPYQRVNHFPRSYELTRKDRMYKNIERMQHLRGMKHFDIVPQSFVLPLEYKDLLTAHNKYRGPWIVKPAASSRGRGIFIVNSPDQIPQDEQVLVSKYVADPLCIDGHKCDLRVYVLVTSFDPLVIYLYKEGLVRLATVKYDRNADNLWNPCMHLCNYSINKYHSDYIKSNDVHDEDVGHKWTLSALLRHLKSQGCDTRQLMLNIEDLIVKSLLSCAQSIISACRMFVPNGNNCFELYGFDILIDDTLKPWLLEINLSPSMGVDSPLDTKVKACLVTDLLTCVGIPALSPAVRAHYDTKWTRFRNISCSRRTSSADPGGNPPAGSKRMNNLNASPILTIEEQRIIRNARLQNARRGGFVRIFPTNDSMQRYGIFLDPATGIPISTSVVQGQQHFVSILAHNHNQMLYNNLYGKESQDRGAKEGNSLDQRMLEYERALPADSPIIFRKKNIEPKCVEEGKRLRKQILKLMDGGSELTILQARQAFAYYLDSVLRRLTQEPKDYHEKLILKFLNRVGSSIKAPVFFRNPQNLRIVNKARSAMVAKLLCDFLEQYNRDTESYVDTFDHYGMIPSTLFNEFLSQAQESDLESVLTMHTNVTGTMPYLYNRFGLGVPPTPPIPSGVYGFLRALPSMVSGGSGSRDYNKYESFYRGSDRDVLNPKNEKLLDTTNKSKHFIKR